MMVLFLFTCSGIDIVRCGHSGNVSLAMHGGGDMDMDCGMTGDCMTVEHLQLSPTDAAQNVHCDFSVVQPVLTEPLAVLSLWLRPAFEGRRIAYVRESIIQPPRSYLNLIQVLLI